MAEPQVRSDGRHRIGLHARRGDDAGLAEVPVDDAPVAHVGREQTERNLRHLGPGDLRPISER